MGISEKMWEGISRVIRMDAKVESLANTVKDQQSRIEDLTGRVIRLETALEIALSVRVDKPPPKKISKSRKRCSRFSANLNQHLLAPTLRFIGIF